MRIMAMKKDPWGKPRAYGIGKTREEALTRANEELNAYRAEKLEVGDQLAAAEFTTEYKEVQ